MTIKDAEGREWVLVPREATAKMLLAPDSQCSHGAIYAAMIAAAPQFVPAAVTDEVSEHLAVLARWSSDEGLP